MTIPSLIHSTVPVIETDDIEKSLHYYAEVLGFTPDFKYGEPPYYAGVKSGETELYFTLNEKLFKLYKESGEHPEIFIWVTHADTLFKAHVDQGAEIIEPISDRPWGARQYVIRDINGYHLKFAQPI